MKKIIFASHDAGGGHRAPAEAIETALHELYPGKYDTKVLDFIHYLGCHKLAEKSKKSWDVMLTVPIINKLGIILLEIFPFVPKLYFNFYLKNFFPKLEEYLKTADVDLIFCTHFFNTHSLAKMKKKGLVKFPVLHFIAEIYDAPIIWVFGNSFPYIVCSEDAKKMLIRKRVKKELIHVFPYPIKPHFTEINKSKDQIKKDIGITNNLPALLISFGAQGIGNIEKFINILKKNELSLNIIVVTGRNQKLYERLKNTYIENLNSKTKIIILGFCKNMNELIFVSDFCFIKPGPATTMECLSFGKPVIFYLSATFSELMNVRFAVKQKVGFYALNNEFLFLRYVKKLLDKEYYDQLKKNFEQFSVTNGANQIARFIDYHLEKQEN